MCIIPWILWITQQYNTKFINTECVCVCIYVYSTVYILCVCIYIQYYIYSEHLFPNPSVPSLTWKHACSYQNYAFNHSFKCGCTDLRIEYLYYPFFPLCDCMVNALLLFVLLLWCYKELTKPHLITYDGRTVCFFISVSANLRFL